MQVKQKQNCLKMSPHSFFDGWQIEKRTYIYRSYSENVSDYV